MQLHYERSFVDGPGPGWQPANIAYQHLISAVPESDSPEPVFLDVEGATLATLNRRTATSDELRAAAGTYNSFIARVRERRPNATITAYGIPLVSTQHVPPLAERHDHVAHALRVLELLPDVGGLSPQIYLTYGTHASPQVIEQQFALRRARVEIAVAARDAMRARGRELVVVPWIWHRRVGKDGIAGPVLSRHDFAVGQVLPCAQGGADGLIQWACETIWIGGAFSATSPKRELLRWAIGQDLGPLEVGIDWNDAAGERPWAQETLRRIWLDRLRLAEQVRHHYALQAAQAVPA